jgi:uncharacterized membrane protein
VPILLKNWVMISATHLHAMLVHFPIALIMVGFLSEIISFFYKKEFFSQTAFYLLVLGTLGTIAAYFAGRSAGDGMDEGSLGAAMELHEQAATVALWLSIFTALLYLSRYIFKFNKTWIRVVGFILFVLLIGAIGRTGYLGGQLVFKHGAGMELGLPEF